MWVTAWLYQLWQCLPKRPISFSPHPEYWVMNYVTGGEWVVGRTADRALNETYQREADTIIASGILSGSPLMSHWGHITCWFLQKAHKHPTSTPCDTPTCSPTSWLDPCACSWGWQEQVFADSMHRKPIWLGMAETHINWAFSTPVGKEKERHSYLAWLFRHTVLRIPSQERTEVWSACIHGKGLRKPQNP